MIIIDKQNRKSILENKDIKELIINCKYNPTAIGVNILKQLGYRVETFEYSTDIFIWDNKDNLLYKYVKP